MIKRLTFLALLLVCGILLKAQINPSNFPELFREDTMPRVDIHIDPDSLETLKTDIGLSHEYTATYIFNNHDGVHDTINNIGFKLRGNGSRTNPDRQSYRVSFNKYEPGRKYYGLEKINLKATQDPSYIRPKLCWYMCRKMGIPSVMVSHVNLYVNNTYWGVYSSVEHTDEVFIKRNFGNNNGNLYKCRYPSALEYISDNPDDYKGEWLYYGDRSIRIYDLKINEDEDDYTDLMQLTDVLNNTPIGELSGAMKEKMNISQLLKFFALEVYMGHWDSYSGNGNNYYLYHNPKTDKFEYITTDMDYTLGTMFGLDDMSTTHIYNWFGDIPTYNGLVAQPPLRHRLLEVEEFRNNYTFYLKQLINTLPPDTVRKKAEAIQNYIYPYVKDDPNFYSSEEQFLAMLDESFSGNYGIIEYLTKSYDAILDEMDISNSLPIISNVEFVKYSSGNSINVTCTTEDDDENINLTLYYSINGGEYGSLPVTNSEAGKLWGAKNHEVSITVDDPNCRIDFYFEASDQEVQITRSPHSGAYTMYRNVNTQDLFINECMSSNNNSITDDFGSRDDWLELYNGSSQTTNLSNKYLSDSKEDTTKWQLPNIDIPAGEFVWFWIDKEANQGDMHANFKLSSGGETVYLYEEQDLDSYVLLDSFKFPEFNKNQSYGRLPDGSDNLTELDYITPGHANNTRGLAFAVFEVDMARLIEADTFKLASDVVDVVGDFNSWGGSMLFSDSNDDSTYTYTEFGLVADRAIEYRFRINNNNSRIESPISTDGLANRQFTLLEGCNNLSHEFNIDLTPDDPPPPDPDTLALPGYETFAHISLYPNPADEVLNISSSLSIDELQLVDINGSIIEHFDKISSTNFAINISNLPAGIYIVRLKVKDKAPDVRRLIKK